jgi:hypothetical protein
MTYFLLSMQVRLMLDDSVLEHPYILIPWFVLDGSKFVSRDEFSAAIKRLGFSGPLTIAKTI